MAAEGGNAQTLSLFPSEYRCWLSCELFFFFFHDYVQMEKEERSFVRVEVWPRSAPPRPSCTSLLQEPTGRLVNDQKLQAMLGEVARSVATL